MGLLVVLAVLAGMHARRSSSGSSEAPSGPAGLSVKRLAAVKSIVVSLAWTGGAIGLCLLESPAAVERPVVVASFWLAVLITPVLLADSLLLDLRDRAADRAFGLHTIAVRIGPRGVHALVGLLLAAAAIATLLGAHDSIDGDRWLRVGIAATSGLALPWFGWRAIRRDEVTTAFTILAWRLLAALAVL